MTNNIKWTVIQYAQHQNNSILVGYKSRGKGGMNEVCAVSPLYDLRDMNLDGTASFTEKFWTSATTLKDPEHVFAIIKSMGPASCMIEAGTQLRDYELISKAIGDALQTLFDICVETLVASLMPAVIQNLALKPIQKAVAAAGLTTANSVYGGALFFLKVGMGSDIRESLISIGMQRNSNGGSH